MLNDPKFALCFARISCHYFLNNCFIQNNQILKNVAKLNGLPGLIVHGRYDILCPVENAYTLHHVWAGSELNIVPGAGHVTSEPGILNALIDATQKMSKQLL
jgi:proline iminopeptidase